MQADFIQLHTTPEQGVGMTSLIRPGRRAQDAASWQGINRMCRPLRKLKEELMRHETEERLLGLWPRQLSCSVPHQLFFELPKQSAHAVDSLPARSVLRSSTRPDETRRADSLFWSYMELNEVCWHLGNWGKELAAAMPFLTCLWRVVLPVPLDSH